MCSKAGSIAFNTPNNLLTAGAHSTATLPPSKTDFRSANIQGGSLFNTAEIAGKCAKCSSLATPVPLTSNWLLFDPPSRLNCPPCPKPARLGRRLAPCPRVSFRVVAAAAAVPIVWSKSSHTLSPSRKASLRNSASAEELTVSGPEEERHGSAVIATLINSAGYGGMGGWYGSD